MLVKKLFNILVDSYCAFSYFRRKITMLLAKMVQSFFLYNWFNYLFLFDADLLFKTIRKMNSVEANTNRCLKI